MEKIFQETRASSNHPSNNPGKARQRNGAEILVLFPHLCTRIWVHDWPDKKAIVDLPITLKGNSKHVTSNSLSPYRRCFSDVTNRGYIMSATQANLLVHKCEKTSSPDSRCSFFSQHAEKPISKANSWGGYGRLSLTFCLPIAVAKPLLLLLLFFNLSLSLSLWMLDTSIHRIKWWRKCGHYIHVGVSSARTEKITWPKLGLANFRIILKASAFLLFLNFSQMHCWVWCKMK